MFPIALSPGGAVIVVLVLCAISFVLGVTFAPRAKAEEEQLVSGFQSEMHRLVVRFETDVNMGWEAFEKESKALVAKYMPHA